MNSETKAQSDEVRDPRGELGADSLTTAFASLRQSAALEFHASVQLLAERARFLTGAAGVAVALEQGGQFVYCAAAGRSVPEINATADITKYPLRKCIKTGQAVHLAIERLSVEASGEGLNPALAIPVLRDQRVVGFFELVPGGSAFEDHDVETVTRLATMVSTALEHLDAAEHAEKLIGQRKLEEPIAIAAPVLWHAPESAASDLVSAASSQTAAPTDVHACTACGFPVSGVRTLCVDCEAHQDDPEADPIPPASLFATEQPESWISAHGYTIASLLVTALAAAIILWLR